VKRLEARKAKVQSLNSTHAQRRFKKGDDRAPARVGRANYRPAHDGKWEIEAFACWRSSFPVEMSG
jgi:hypothetical protein